MATLATTLSTQASARIAASPRFHARPSLWWALGLSIRIHVAWSLWPVEPPKSADDVVLSATLTEMPAPPTAAAPSPAAKPRPKPKRVVPIAPLPKPTPETAATLEGDT